MPPTPKRRFPGQLQLEFFRDRLGTVRSIARECGAIGQFSFWPIHFYLISEPNLIEQLIVDQQPRIMQGLPIQNSKRLFGDGLITAENPLHDRQRRVLQPMLDYPRVYPYAQAITEGAQRTPWKDGQVVDIQEEMRRICLVVANKVLFDEDVEEYAAEASAAATQVMFGIDRLNLPIGRLIDRFPVPPTLKFRRGVEFFDQLVGRMMQRSREHRRGLMAELVGHESITEQQVRDELSVALFAAYVLNGTALTWAWYLLARHPDAQRRLHEELDGALGGREPGANELERLGYTRAVTLETMRLYPPIWTLSRQVLEDIDVGGYELRAGSQVFCPQYTVQRDPRRYPEPDRFRPERWLEGPRPAPLTYFPFGWKQRLCTGEPLSWVEQALVVATIGSRWAFELVEKEPIQRRPWLAQFPLHGIKMRVRPRA
ncbi:MAG: cytochrome P450 [Actinomycetota bacterium]|nr:cytochrome P450 [Actinomycetota bacterium]